MFQNIMMKLYRMWNMIEQGASKSKFLDFYREKVSHELP